MTSRAEIKFIERLSRNPEKYFLAGSQAVMEGFEYFTTPEYKRKAHAVQNRMKIMATCHGIRGIFHLGKTFVRIMPSMKKNISRNFSDMEFYLEKQERGRDTAVPHSENDHTHNARLWKELIEYAWEKHRVIVGFTEAPREYIFEGKAIPFKYALVFAQEMQKKPIEKAPELEAGIEVIKVYNSLGIATNDIAEWLRKKYGINCMANHPLGGLVDNIPLAEKAGLGAIGRHGLLITKNFGPRCRISPIFMEEPIFDFTDSREHETIRTFCSKCGKCARSCPVGAIYDEPKPVIDYNNPELRNRHEAFDREKCFTSFSAHMGCGVCIAVCPFSKNPGLYQKLEKQHAERNLV